jgi:adenine-specific DNA glycosylase
VDADVTEETGPIADEAARLAAALEAWLRQAAGGLGAAVADQVAVDSPECRLCPVCQALRLVRSTRPEAFEHLLGAGAALAAAVRAAVSDSERAWMASRRPPVEKIDVTE